MRRVCGTSPGVWNDDELFEALTLIQTKKVAEFPVVLVGTWSGLLDWVKQTMEIEQGNISEGDDLLKVVDTADKSWR